MTSQLLSLLRCPATGGSFDIRVISTGQRSMHGQEQEIVQDAILFTKDDWFYPVIGGIPRLLIESFLDFEDFLSKHLPDFNTRKAKLLEKYAGLIDYALRKNRKTKRSFEQEWGLYDYNETRTWGADKEGMLARFLEETNETLNSLRGKLIFDAGCGNGQLNQLIAARGSTVLGMDFSRSIDKAYRENNEPAAFFIQGDIQFPPVAPASFDIVHCSGVLIHTDNTKKSFDIIERYVKNNGKLSVWLYHPQKNKIHNLLLQLRKITSGLSPKMQAYFCKFILLPPVFIIKRLKGNRQDIREMMIELLDQFGPEFRWEHEHAEVINWFSEKKYSDIRITTVNQFGFNIIGSKNSA